MASRVWWPTCTHFHKTEIFIAKDGVNNHAPSISRLSWKCDGTRAETRHRLSAKRTSPFKSTGASVQSTTGSRGVRISGSNAGYTMFGGSVKGTSYSIRQFPPSLPQPVRHCVPSRFNWTLHTSICNSPSVDSRCQSSDGLDMYTVSSSKNSPSIFKHTYTGSYKYSAIMLHQFNPLTFRHRASSIQDRHFATHDVAGHRPATSWVHYTTNCNTQSSAPEDG